MAKPFFDRLKAYYMKVGETLRGEAEAASISPTLPISVYRAKESMQNFFDITSHPAAISFLEAFYLASKVKNQNKSM